MLKFTGYKVLNNISDSGKAFLIILVSDILLGYVIWIHSLKKIYACLYSSMPVYSFIQHAFWKKKSWHLSWVLLAVEVELDQTNRRG
jgi:hypothetical protein